MKVVFLFLKELLLNYSKRFVIEKHFSSTFFCMVNKFINQSHVIMKKLTETKTITEFTKHQINPAQAAEVKGGIIIMEDIGAG